VGAGNAARGCCTWVSPQPGMTHFSATQMLYLYLGSIERARGEVVLAGTVTCSAVGASVGATVNATVNSSVLAACIGSRVGAAVRHFNVTPAVVAAPRNRFVAIDQLPAPATSSPSLPQCSHFPLSGLQARSGLLQTPPVRIHDGRGPRKQSSPRFPHETPPSVPASKPAS